MSRTTTSSSSIRTVVAVTASLMIMMIIIIPKRVRHTMTTIPFDRDHIVDAKKTIWVCWFLSLESIQRPNSATLTLLIRASRPEIVVCTTVRTTVLGSSYSLARDDTCVYGNSKYQLLVRYQRRRCCWLLVVSFGKMKWSIESVVIILFDTRYNSMYHFLT